ncbi:hypothetical protein FK521_27285, partial [Klebsiella pneumoniae]|nr:hypothetical protein [Klebsiella pneumoniae]
SGSTIWLEGVPLLDNGQGGSGQRFDWSLLQGQDLRNVMLAGGLGADNCVEAAKSGCAGLDFNSGVESQPTQTSDATVVRAIQALGFAGLRELKQTM